MVIRCSGCSSQRSGPSTCFVSHKARAPKGKTKRGSRGWIISVYLSCKHQSSHHGKTSAFWGGGVFTLHSWFILDDTGWDPSQSFQRLAPPPWESPDQLVDPNQALRSPAFRLALPPTSCVALSKTRRFSGLQRSHLEQVGLGNSPTPNPALLPFLHTRPPSPLLTPSGECPSFFTEITYSYKK